MLRAILSTILLTLSAPLLLVPTSTTAAAVDYCEIEGVRFAGCDPGARLFEAVIVAIPGWNGTCFDSFGVAESNLLNVMRRVNFFDVDCFDYDSHRVSLQTSAQLLRERLQLLAEAGYREVSFVTHSTGGVLALQLLLMELTTDQAAAIRLGDERSLLFRGREGLKLVALYAWGIPINGVRDHICAAGWLGNLVDASPAVLPYLCADSEYLAGLKELYVAFNALYQQLSAPERSGLRFILYILQGQGDDWVVNEIAQGDPWLPANAEVHLVNTLSGHTTVVGENGTIEFPTFSGETMADKSQLYFSLLPRTATYFQAGLTPTETLDSSQRTIVGGVVDFASVRNLFTAGAAKVSEFVVMLFNGRFVRDVGFDEYAVGKLDELLRYKADSLGSHDAVQYGDRLLADIDTGYVEPNTNDEMLFGGQSKDAVTKLAQTVQYLFETISRLVNQDPDLSRELANSNQSLAEFEQRVDRVLARFLVDTDIETRNAALAAYSVFAQSASVEGLESIDFSASLGTFASTNYRTMSIEQKAALGDVFTSLSSRSEKVGADVLVLLNQKQQWLDSEAPLWVPLLNDEQVEFFVGRSLTFDTPAAPEFLTEVVANAGRYGQSYTVALRAIDQYDAYLTDLPRPQQIEGAEVLIQGIGESAYPAVRMQGFEMLAEHGLVSR